MRTRLDIESSLILWKLDPSTFIHFFIHTSGIVSSWRRTHSRWSRPSRKTWRARSLPNSTGTETPTGMETTTATPTRASFPTQHVPRATRETGVGSACRAHTGTSSHTSTSAPLTHWSGWHASRSTTCDGGCSRLAGTQQKRQRRQVEVVMLLVVVVANRQAIAAALEVLSSVPPSYWRFQTSRWSRARMTFNRFWTSVQESSLSCHRMCTSGSTTGYCIRYRALYLMITTKVCVYI